MFKKNTIKKTIFEVKREIEPRLKKLELSVKEQDKLSKECIENGNKIGHKILVELSDIKEKMNELENLVVFICKEHSINKNKIESD